MAQDRTSRTFRSRTLRSVALLTGGVLALPALAGCGADEAELTGRATQQDIATTARQQVGEGGTLRWAVDTMPTTLNTFQADADATTTRVAQAVLPALFTLDANGRPQRNPDYVESAEIVEREPKQVVLYKLNQKAVWSDGREIGAADFVSQWQALSGRNTTFWTARNAGYDRIEQIQKGANDLEVRITFKKPYADWQSLFTPLYPKDVTGLPKAFNDGARNTIKATAGPFRIAAIDRKKKDITLVRNPRWWGEQTKLDAMVLTAVPRNERAAALAAGKVDIAEIDRNTADRIALALRNKSTGGQQPGHGPQAALTPGKALRLWAIANGSDEEAAEAARTTREKTADAIKAYAAEQAGLRGFTVRKTLEPAYTQLALNGESGPLADDRVRRAIARALDRGELAETVLRPLGLPAEPPGSHLALKGQRAYTDNSGSLGEQNTQEAQALLTDAGWTPGGALKKPGSAEAGASGSPAPSPSEDGGSDGKNPARSARQAEVTIPASGRDTPTKDGLYIVGDEKSGGSTRVLAPAPVTFEDLSLQRRAGLVTDTDTDTGGAGKGEDAKDTGRGVTGAYAPAGTAAPVAAGGSLGKDGKPLTLRFVLPSGPGSESLRAVGEKISGMLKRIGVRTEITKVADESYFKDHIASGQYDLALYSWPATAYPATDARPIFAKPEPASDGSLLVEQNYTRVGTDYIDQLFDQAVAELDQDEARDLVRRADARIWAAAGSIPLYQRPELVAVRPTVLNAGAFGFATPRLQDIGFTPAAAAKAGPAPVLPSPSPSASGDAEDTENTEDAESTDESGTE
ncbi:ABC transporter family substrate-binding protein [Streptomyces sp. NPDC020875]|uniref:ABC transporter family substrate-binding protein n=1 Tax=Streptomyces sp. NPDC020875 TaxID=3154898 RepID=UPI0033E7AC09